MPKIDLKDAEIHYETKGDGKPLVLVPGFASGAWSWAWQADELAEVFRIVTFDPRGIGGSTKRDGALVSIQSIADDISELMESLNIESAHVLGISFGGFVAQEFALKYPAKVKKLVLASTSFGGPNHVAPSMQVLAAFASTEGLNSEARIRQYLTMAFSHEFVKTESETVDRFCDLRQRNLVAEEVYMQQLRSAMSFDAEARMPQISAETLIITGEADTVVPVQNSANLAAAIPRARLEIIKCTGHMAFVEKADEFNEIVRDFLTAEASPRGRAA